MTLKLGNKVRNIHDNSEGYLVYSSSGASVSGITYQEDDTLCHFQTLGYPISTYEADWKRVYKFKYDMKRYEEERDNESISNK